MRIALLPVLVFAVGCSSTIGRLEGELKTPSGTARSACEEDEWLVAAPTRYQTVPRGGGVGSTRRDGIGLYRVGVDDPVPIPRLDGELGPSPLIATHAEAVKKYDRKRVASASMAGAGLVAMAVGAVVFANAFKTTTAGGGEEEQEIDGGQAVGGGIVFGTGFGLAIASMILTPSAAERARAEQARYVFAPPEDDSKRVLGMVEDHNSAVRQRCGRGGSDAPAAGAAEDRDEVTGDAPAADEAETDADEPSEAAH